MYRGPGCDLPTNENVPCISYDFHFTNSPDRREYVEAIDSQDFALMVSLSGTSSVQLLSLVYDGRSPQRRWRISPVLLWHFNGLLNAALAFCVYFESFLSRIGLH